MNLAILVNLCYIISRLLAPVDLVFAPGEAKTI